MTIPHHVAASTATRRFASRRAPDVRTILPPLMMYLNAGVIVLGLLFGCWAEYDKAPATKPAHGIGTSLERWDEALLLRPAGGLAPPVA